MAKIYSDFQARNPEISLGPSVSPSVFLNCQTQLVFTSCRVLHSAQPQPRFCFHGQLQGNVLMGFRDTRMIFIPLSVVRYILPSTNATLAFPAGTPSVGLPYLHEGSPKLWPFTFHFHDLSHICPPSL